jgi:hypothetical protein
MKQRQERADKGQPRKPAGQKRTHNWQVLLNDDENAIIENYLEKGGIDKAFFMRRAMLRSVPKSFRTLLGEPLEAPPAADPAPELPVNASISENQAPPTPEPQKRPRLLKLLPDDYLKPKEQQTPAPEATKPARPQIRQIVKRDKPSEEQS